MSMILTFLAVSTLFLTVTGLVVLLLVRLGRCRSSRLTQIAWCLVLLQGIVFFRFPVDLPLLKPETQPVVMTGSMERQALPFVPNTSFEPSEPQQLNQSPKRQRGPQEPSVEPTFRWKTSHTIMLLFTCWISGVVLLVFRQMYSWLQTLNLLLAQDVPSEEHQFEWLTLLEEEKIDPKKLRLIMTEFAGPGLFQLPVGHAVVIPTTLWQEATPEVRRGILRHELSHYRHNDLAKSFLLRLIALLHWFNPVAWLAVRRFEEAVEWRCDVEAFGHDPEGGANFAEALLVFRDTTPIAAVYRHAFCSTNIITRVQRLIEHNENKGDSLMKKTCILAATILLLGFGLIRFNLTAKPVLDEGGQPENSASENQANNPQELFEKDIKCVKVRGKALLPDGKPAKGFHINWQVQFKKYESAGGSGNNYVADDGTFSIDVFADSNGIIAVLDPNNQMVAPYQLFSVDDKDLEEKLVFQFEPAIKISGVVRDRETGEPIPNLEMMFQIQDENPYLGVYITGSTDKDGRYEWGIFPKGKIYITVGREFRTNFLDELQRNDLPDGARQFFQKQVEQIKDYVRKVEFDGKKEIMLDFDIPSSFVGKVLKSDGSPVDGFTVHIIAYDKQDMDSMSSFAKTDKNGIFRCVKKPKNVSVKITDYRNKEFYLNWFDDELTKDGEHVFKLKPSCIVKGRLIDTATGEPMPEQMFIYHGSDPGNPDRKEFMPNSAKTDHDGCFTLDRSIADNVKYDMFIAPGRTEPSGSYPIRVELGEFLIEKPGETLDLGDIKVDLTQAKRVEE